MSHPIHMCADGQVEYEEDLADCPHWFIRYQEVESKSDLVAVVCNTCDKYLRAARRADIPRNSPNANLRRPEGLEAAQ